MNTNNEQRKLILRFVEFAAVAANDFDGDLIAAVDDTLNDTESIGLESAGATVLSAKTEGDDIIATVMIDPKCWIRQGIQLDEDVYTLLAELKPQLPPEEIADLVGWMKSENFGVTIVTSDEDGMTIDEYPTTPGL